MIYRNDAVRIQSFANTASTATTFAAMTVGASSGMTIATTVMITTFVSIATINDTSRLESTATNPSRFCTVRENAISVSNWKWIWAVMMMKTPKNC